MKWSNAPRNGLALVLTLGLSACTAPPSVAPLLRIADQALRGEAQSLLEDQARDRGHLEQTRQALDSAFERDLDLQTNLSGAWVKDAARVYAAAVEAVTRHEMTLAQERRQRADNLLLAAQAQQRALELLEQQDALILRVVGVDLWRLTLGLNNPQPETR